MSLSTAGFKSRFTPWVAVFMGSLFYCYQFILRVSPNVMTDELRESFHVDAYTLSWVVSAYYLGYASMQIPVGLAMDRIGARRIVGMAALTCGTATYLFSIAHDPYTAAFMRLLIGISSACGYLGTIKLGTEWLPRNKIPYVVSIAMLFGTLGACAGNYPLEYMLNSYGWRETLTFLSFVGIGLSGMMFLFINKKPANNHKKERPRNPFSDLMQIIKKKNAWTISLFAALMYVPISVIGDLYGISFLEKRFGISESQATMATTAMFIGIAAGSFCFAWLTQNLGSRKKPMLLGATVCLLLYIIIIYIDGLSFTSVCILLFLAGFFFNGQCLSFTCIYETMPAHAGGISVGFVNMLTMGLGMVIMPLTGKILVVLWDGTMSGGIPIYSYENYKTALTLIPISLILSVICVFFITETYEKSEKASSLPTQ